MELTPIVIFIVCLFSRLHVENSREKKYSSGIIIIERKKNNPSERKQYCWFLHEYSKVGRIRSVDCLSHIGRRNLFAECFRPVNTRAQNTRGPVFLSRLPNTEHLSLPESERPARVTSPGKSLFLVGGQGVPENAFSPPRNIKQR